MLKWIVIVNTELKGLALSIFGTGIGQSVYDTLIGVGAVSIDELRRFTDVQWNCLALLFDSKAVSDLRGRIGAASETGSGVPVLSSEATKWTIDHVARWIQSFNPTSREYESYADRFRTNGVDGSMLLHDVTDKNLNEWIANESDRRRIRDALIGLGRKVSTATVPPNSRSEVDVKGLVSTAAASGGTIYMNFGTASSFGTGSLHVNVSDANGPASDAGVIQLLDPLVKPTRDSAFPAAPGRKHDTPAYALSYQRMALDAFARTDDRYADVSSAHVVVNKNIRVCLCDQCMWPLMACLCDVQLPVVHFVRG